MNMLGKMPMSQQNEITITSVDIEREFQRRKYNKLEWMFPDTGPFRRELYGPHMEFFRATAHHTEVAFIAGNRTGKSEAMVFACTLHATGLYSDWWEGKRFDRPVNILAVGETSKLVRDSMQKKFLGDPSDIGSGMIPKHLIINTTPKHGMPGAIDIIKVAHVSGGVSIIQLQSYDQGRAAFQATERDVIALDEEPPMAIYTECLMRTMTTKGILMAAFTPLSGISEVVLSFMPGGKPTGVKKLWNGE